MNEVDDLKQELEKIGRLAMSCWMDSQGRLIDDEHRRMHRILEKIAAIASSALSK